MDSWLELGIAGIGASGTALAGLYALVRYFVKQNQQTMETFLKHLQEKNGHTERIANNFANATKEMTEKNVRSGEKIVSAISENTQEIKLLTQAHLNKK